MNPLYPIVGRFGRRFAAIESCEPVGGGFSGAAVWKIVAQAVPFALRRWPPDSDGNHLRSLHRLLNHLGNGRTPIAVPVADEQGQTLLEHAGHWWQIEPWLPGRADFRESPTDEKLASAMRALATFHIAAETFVPCLDDVDRFGGPVFGPAPTIVDRETLLLQRVLGDEYSQLAAAVPPASGGEFADLARRALREFQRNGERVSGELRHARSITVPLVPCLRDVWHDHVLFAGSKVTGLIDPAACRQDTVATDLSRLLGSLIGDDFPRWTAALGEYARYRPLSTDEVALIPVLDRSGLLLSAATWLRRRYLFGHPCDTPAVIARLREAVVRLEQLSSPVGMRMPRRT